MYERSNVMNIYSLSIDIYISHHIDYTELEQADTETTVRQCGIRYLFNLKGTTVC